METKRMQLKPFRLIASYQEHFPLTLEQVLKLKTDLQKWPKEKKFKWLSWAIGVQFTNVHTFVHYHFNKEAALEYIEQIRHEENFVAFHLRYPIYFLFERKE